jgi:dTDP-4-dehydrorhamnose reductase
VAARTAQCRLIHVSTDYVFDGSKPEPYSEADAVCPINAYGASKLLGEQLILQEHPAGSAVVRTSWLFGPHGKCFPATMLAAARSGKPLKVVADQTGSPTLTLHLAPALLDLAVLPSAPESTGIFHGTNTGTTTWHGLTVELLRQAGLGSLPVAPCGSDEYPTPAARPKNSVLANSRMLILGLSPLPAWQDAVADYLQFLKSTE